MLKLNWPLKLAVLTILALISYWPILFTQQLVNPDAQLIFPILLKATTLGEYLKFLLHFFTLDFQPIRDLSLLIDISIFNSTGFNSMILQNLVWWFASLCVLEKLIKNTHPTIKAQHVFCIVALFSIYPLFSQTVGWGIARKHLLSFFFTLLATERLTRQDSPFNLKASLILASYSLLAILSQPINVLWALWALIYSWQNKLLKTQLKYLTPALIIMAAGIVINYLYYTQSPVFLAYYGKKTNEAFAFSDMILALGHYFFQIFIPYLLAFTYTLAHWSTLVGIPLMVCFFYVLHKRKIASSFILIWSSFALLPLLVILNKPSMLFDSYLLIPATGVLILLIPLLQSFKLKYLPQIAIIALIIWSALNIHQVQQWKDDHLLAKRSFERRPSCLAAAMYLSVSYENEQLPTDKAARDFIYNFECPAFSYTGKSQINLQAYMLFYETDLSFEERRNALEKISQMGIVPQFLLSSFYIKHQMYQEADESIEMLVAKWRGKRYSEQHILVVEKMLKPYCEEKRHALCLEVIKPFDHKRSTLFYK